MSAQISAEKLNELFFNGDKSIRKILTKENITNEIKKFIGEVISLDRETWLQNAILANSRSIKHIYDKFRGGTDRLSDLDIFFLLFDRNNFEFIGDVPKDFGSLVFSDALELQYTKNISNEKIISVEYFEARGLNKVPIMPNCKTLTVNNFNLDHTMCDFTNVQYCTKIVSFSMSNFGARFLKFFNDCDANNGFENWRSEGSSKLSQMNLKFQKNTQIESVYFYDVVVDSITPLYDVDINTLTFVGCDIEKLDDDFLNLRVKNIVIRQSEFSNELISQLRKLRKKKNISLESKII